MATGGRVGEGVSGEGVAAGRYGARAWAPGSTSAPGKKQRLHAGTQLSLFSLGPQPREWNGATTLPAPPSNPHRQAPVFAPPVTLNPSKVPKHRLKSAKAKVFTQGGVCLQSLGTGSLPVTFTQPLVPGVFTQPRCPSFTKWVGLVMYASLL